MISFLAVVGSIVLNSTNYNAFEADGAVSVCAVIMAEALQRTIIVQLTSQDSTARSKYITSSPQHVPSMLIFLLCGNDALSIALIIINLGTLLIAILTE